MRRFKVEEYEVVEDLKNGIFKVLRNGEEWKDLIGDNFTLSLIDKIEYLEEQLSETNSLLNEAYSLIGDVQS